MTETAFGYHAVESVIRHEPGRIQALHVQADRQDKRMQSLLALARNQGVTVVTCARSDLDALVDGRHQGVLPAVLHPSRTAGSAGMMLESALAEHIARAVSPLILILDGVTDPHNLGACLRSADAAGVTAVIFPKDKSADVTDVARKVASGAAETVPWVRVTNLARTIDSLKQAGVWIIGTDGEAHESLYERDLTGPCAIVLGSEGSACGG